MPTTTQRTTTSTRSTTTTTTRRAWTTQSPFYNPSNPSYSGGGNYFGNRYGDGGGSIYGGGGSSYTTRSTTRRPSSPSSSSSGSFLSGLSSFLANDGGKIIQGFLSNRGGSTGSNSGFGSLFGGDTRPLIENKNYRGGLFNENTNSNSNSGAYPITRYGENSSPTQQQQPSQSSGLSHGNVGWKLS